MSIIKKLYYKWRAYKVRSMAKQKVREKLFNSPLAYTRAMNEIDCMVNGHQWSSEFDPKTEINKNFKDRVYCKHCGVRWHQHAYKEIKNS